MDEYAGVRRKPDETQASRFRKTREGSLYYFFATGLGMLLERNAGHNCFIGRRGPTSDCPILRPSCFFFYHLRRVTAHGVDFMFCNHTLEEIPTADKREAQVTWKCAGRSAATQCRSRMIRMDDLHILRWRMSYKKTGRIPKA